MDEIPHTIVDHTGEVRCTGLLPSSPAFLASVPLWEEVEGNEIIPEKDWIEFAEPVWPTPVKNQDGIGACAGHMLASCGELALFVSGLTVVPLSAWWCYGQAASWPFDTGSNIGDHLTNGQRIGIAPEEFIPYKEWNRNKFTAEAKAEALKYRIEIGAKITSDAAFASAYQRREPIGFAIPAGARLGDLDSEGVSPLGWGPCNHAVTAWGGMRRSKKRPGNPWLFLWANSWDILWGLEGKAWLPIDGITQTRYFEAFTLRAMRDVPGDEHNPPLLA